MSRPLATFVAAVALLAAVAGCSAEAPDTPDTGAPAAQAPAPAENDPAGDIPDNQVFIPYQDPAGGFEVKVPEGWARTTGAAGITFTDKLNSVTIASHPATAAPTVDSARSTDIPAIRQDPHTLAVTADPQPVQRAAGTGVLVVYRAKSDPDPVTGKVIEDAVGRYEFFHAGTLVILTLSGPVGADNVDPWRTVTDSLRWLK